MAARLNRRHQDFVREKIQASQLVNRLQGHALGENEMTPTQIKAAEILLRKSIPDLSSIDANITGSLGVHEMSDAELDRAIAAAAAEAGIAVAASGAGEAEENP